MLKKIFALILTVLIAFGCTACKEEPEPTEPVVQIPTNVFTNQADDLDYLVMDEKVYRLNASLPAKLRENGYAEGTDDTATALALGYPKGDAKYLFYDCDNNSANCVYVCIVENSFTMTISYRVIDPYKLGVDSAVYTTANHRTMYANYLGPDKTVDEVLSFLGQPSSAESNSSGFISKLIYQHENDEGKVDNKIEIEFVGERVYKITVSKKLKIAED